MEKLLRLPFTVLLMVVACIGFVSCDKDDGPGPDLNSVEELTGSLTTDRTLDAAEDYLIKGQFFIENGVTLTIPAGTIIKGDKGTKGTLIVKPGGKLVANGEPGNPVVFTSKFNPGERDRGDWGGIVILGNAWVNQADRPAIEGINPPVQYGNTTSPSTNATENSGTLRYVRIEYAGIELTPNNETNSLTMGGVGNGTIIENVQVSFGGDDGFEWFGGTVNCKNLISLSTWDDDFDVDFGYQGKVQFGLAVRNPFFADQSSSNGFEVDNQANADATNGGEDGYTQAVFSNITILGPRDYTSPARSLSGNYGSAMHIRRRAAISIFNSLFTGFPTGFRMDDDATASNYDGGLGVLSNNILLATNTDYSNGNLTTASKAKSIWEADNTTQKSSADWSSSSNPYSALGLTSSLFFAQHTAASYPSDPNFAVTGGTLATGAEFSSDKFDGDSFFATVTHIGAFGSSDWTDGWAEFQPLNKEY